MSRVLLLSHRGNVSSSSSRFFFFALSSSLRAHTFLIVVFKLQRQCILVSGRNWSFYSTDRAPHHTPRRFTIVQRPRSDAPLPPPPPSPRARRINFLQIGILLQFASSSIILASSAGSSTSSSISLLQLFVHAVPYFPPPLFSRTLADLGCLQSIRDLSKCR